MPRPFRPSLITANHLPSGAVVYLAPRRRWVRSIARAEIFHEEETARARLAWARAGAQALTITGAQLAAVDPATRIPLANREKIRAAGPFSLPPPGTAKKPAAAAEGSGPVSGNTALALGKPAPAREAPHVSA